MSISAKVLNFAIDVAEYEKNAELAIELLQVKQNEARRKYAASKAAAAPEDRNDATA